MKRECVGARLRVELLLRSNITRSGTAGRQTADKFRSSASRVRGTQERRCQLAIGHGSGTTSISSSPALLLSSSSCIVTYLIFVW